jgi:hypothetical protein
VWVTYCVVLLGTLQEHAQHTAENKVLKGVEEVGGPAGVGPVGVATACCTALHCIAGDNRNGMPPC